MGIVHPKRDLVLRMAVGRDPIPMPLDQVRELLERFQPLPAQRGTPLVEEVSRSRLALVRPQLRELFFEHRGGVESFVRREEGRQGSPLLRREILPMREEPRQ